VLPSTAGSFRGVISVAFSYAILVYFPARLLLLVISVYTRVGILILATPF